MKKIISIAVTLATLLSSFGAYTVSAEDSALKVEGYTAGKQKLVLALSENVSEFDTSKVKLVKDETDEIGFTGYSTSKNLVTIDLDEDFSEESVYQLTFSGIEKASDVSEWFKTDIWADDFETDKIWNTDASKNIWDSNDFANNTHATITDADGDGDNELKFLSNGRSLRPLVDDIENCKYEDISIEATLKSVNGDSTTPNITFGLRGENTQRVWPNQKSRAELIFRGYSKQTSKVYELNSETTKYEAVSTCEYDATSSFYNGNSVLINAIDKYIEGYVGGKNVISLTDEIVTGGRFYIVGANGTIDDIRVTATVPTEAPAHFTVNTLNAGQSSIYLTTSSALASSTLDITKLHLYEDGTAVGITSASASGNEITVALEKELAENKVYKFTADSRFGDSTATLLGAYETEFKVKRIKDDFSTDKIWNEDAAQNIWSGTMTEFRNETNAVIADGVLKFNGNWNRKLYPADYTTAKYKNTVIELKTVNTGGGNQFEARLYTRVTPSNSVGAGLSEGVTIPLRGYRTGTAIEMVNLEADGTKTTSEPTYAQTIFNTQRNVRVISADENIRLYIDNTLYGSIEDTVPTEGTFAIDGYLGSIDDFCMTATIPVVPDIEAELQVTCMDTDGYEASWDSADKVTAFVDLKNNTEDKKTAAVIFAFYDTNGKMLDAYTAKSVEILAGETNSTMMENADMPEGAAYVRAYVWDSLENLTPYTGSLKFPQ